MYWLCVAIERNCFHNTTVKVTFMNSEKKQWKMYREAQITCAFLQTASNTDS